MTHQGIRECRIKDIAIQYLRIQSKNRLKSAQIDLF